MDDESMVGRSHLENTVRIIKAYELVSFFVSPDQGNGYHLFKNRDSLAIT